MTSTLLQFCFSAEEIGQPFDFRIKIYNKGA